MTAKDHERMNIKHIFQNTASKVVRLGFILIIYSLAGEIALRAYHYFKPISIFYSSSYNRFRPEPFADEWDFKLNSLGFKDEEFAAKKENVYRILGIGGFFCLWSGALQI
jgi:hypothetical protein